MIHRIRQAFVGRRGNRLRSRPGADPAHPADHGKPGPFRTIAWVTVVLLNLFVPLTIVVQPSTLWRSTRTLLIANVIVLLAAVLSSRRRRVAAGWVYVGGLATLVTVNAVDAGGVRATGIHFYPLFVVVAGLLLGRASGIAVAVVCAVITLAFAAAEQVGVLPVQVHDYGAIARWFLVCLNIGVSLFAMCLFTSTVETTSRRAARNLARRLATETRLQHALEAGAVGVFDYDIATETLQGDARVAAITGLPFESGASIPMTAFEAIVHPDDVQRFVDSARAFIRGEFDGRLTYRIVRPDGGLRHVSAAAYLTLNERHMPVAVVGMMVDVTDAMLAQQERERLVRDLGERVKELRLLHGLAGLLHDRPFGPDVLDEAVRQLPDGWQYSSVCEARLVYRDIETTTAGWRRTEWCQTEVFNTSEGQGVVEVVYLEHRPAADEGPFLKEERALIRSVAEMLRSRCEEHAAARRRRVAEAQLKHSQKVEALGTLAGGIAHDFNNILTAIGGFAELTLARLQPGSDEAANVSEILRAHTRAKDLVRRILLFGRSGESEKRLIHAAPVVDEAVQLLRAALPPGVEIRTRSDEDVPTVLADAAQIHQVVMNLGTNAAYAMGSGGGTLFIEVSSARVTSSDARFIGLEEGPYARLTIRDTGCGMTPDVLDRLFEPFFTTKGPHGTGLGLSVVHGIVRDHGGTILVDSATGRGSTFDVYLPGAVAGDDHRAEDAVEIVQGDGQRLLLVDDEEAVVNVIARALTMMGYRCRAFTDPVEALAVFAAAPDHFDAVVTDLHMPLMSGVELAKRLAEHRPGIRVAVLSGRLGEPVEAVPGAGMVVRIDKPWSVAGLSVAIGNLVAECREETPE